MIPSVKSVYTKALAVECSMCNAAVGELSRRSDGQDVTFKGHAGVHLPRMLAARHIKTIDA